MADPIASQILTETATVIEGTAPPSWRAKPPFRRLRAQGGQGGTPEPLPEPSDPRRGRFFTLLFESSLDDPSQASDEDRWCFQGVMLIRIYYADISTIPGDDNKGFIGSRMQVDDHMMLHRRLIQQQLVKAAIAGVSIAHNTNAIYLPAQTDWRVTVRWEEMIP